MGREVCRTVRVQPDLDLVAAVDTGHAGSPLAALIGPGGGELVVTGRLEELVEAGAEVVVDFTHIGAVRSTLAFCADAGLHVVVGTSGLSEDELEGLAVRFGGTGPRDAHCMVVPNFAVGAVLLMRFCEMAAPYFDGAEIIELHHSEKADAPSGTAMATAQRMARARSASGAGDFPPDRTEVIRVTGARGGSGPGGVRLHSVRLPGLVAHQEVTMGTVGESLTLRHDSSDRSSFMHGVVMAIRAVSDRPGLTVGLEPLLGL
jgi:4-hydroxy-tetrahydrodipicolinate reductase